MQKSPKQLVQFQVISLVPGFPVRPTYYRVLNKEITSLHYHTCAELGICRSGSGQFMVGSEIFSYHPYDCFFINGNVPHRAKTSGTSGSEWIFIYLDLEALAFPNGFDKKADLKKLSLPFFKGSGNDSDPLFFRKTIEEMVEELSKKPRHYRQQVRFLMGVLWTILNRLPGGKPLPAQTVKGLERIAPALEAMQENFEKKLKMADIAETCFMSLTHFDREFKKIMGHSPKEYLTRLRIETACSYLEKTTKPVSNISFRVGFPTVSSLNRNFKRLKKMSPTRWRKVA